MKFTEYDNFNLSQINKDVLKKFRKWQPDAVIYVQSIMGVSPKKDKTDPVFNNTNIRDKNYAISKLTDGIHIFYLNIQEIYEDKNHNLAQDLSLSLPHTESLCEKASHPRCDMCWNPDLSL